MKLKRDLSSSWFNDFRKLKFLDKFLIILSNNKIILKDLEKPDENRTLKIANGEFDVNKTKE